MIELVISSINVDICYLKTLNVDPITTFNDELFNEYNIQR